MSIIVIVLSRRRDGKRVSPSPNPVPSKPSVASKKISYKTVKKGERVPFGGYEWDVLHIETDAILLLCKEIVDVRCYHRRGSFYSIVVLFWCLIALLSIITLVEDFTGEYLGGGLTSIFYFFVIVLVYCIAGIFTNVSWAGSHMRSYLNEDFYNTLGDDKAIIEPRKIDDENIYFYRRSGKYSEDYVFLLSIYEVIEYLDKFPVQPYHFRKNRFPYELYISEKNNDENRLAFYGKYGKNKRSITWWLRSQGRKRNQFACVSESGGIFISGTGADILSRYGVRPAVWIKKEP